jgi:sensor domain CHASE-containing protein
MQVAFAPILTSHGEGMPMGTLVVGQLLDDEKVEELARNLKMHVALY